MVELGGCDWVLLVCLPVWDRPAVQNQRWKCRGWPPPFCRVGKVASPRQVAQRAKVEGGGVALIGRMWWNLVDVTGSGWCTCWCGTGLLYKIRGTSPGVGPPHFVE